MKGLALVLGVAAVLAALLVWGFAAGTFWFTFPLVFSTIGGFGLGMQWFANTRPRMRNARASGIVMEAILRGAHSVDIAALVRAGAVDDVVAYEWRVQAAADAARWEKLRGQGDVSGR